MALPDTVRLVATVEDPVWLDMAADDVFVYVLAGTRFDTGRLREMVCQVRDARVPVPTGLFPVNAPRKTPGHT